VTEDALLVDSRPLLQSHDPPVSGKKNDWEPLLLLTVSESRLGISRIVLGWQGGQTSNSN